MAPRHGYYNVKRGCDLLHGHISTRIIALFIMLGCVFFLLFTDMFTVMYIHYFKLRFFLSFSVERIVLWPFYNVVMNSCADCFFHVTLINQVDCWKRNSNVPDWSLDDVTTLRWYRWNIAFLEFTNTMIIPRMNHKDSLLMMEDIKKFNLHVALRTRFDVMQYLILTRYVRRNLVDYNKTNVKDPRLSPSKWKGQG